MLNIYRYVKRYTIGKHLVLSLILENKHGQVECIWYLSSPDVFFFVNPLGCDIILDGDQINVDHMFGESTVLID